MTSSGPMGRLRIETLRRAEEIEGVIAVEAASFTNPWTREMYLAELDNLDRAHCLLAKDDERDGQIVGFCSFWLIVDEIHINNLAVLPEYRRQGIALALLARTLDEGLRLGAVRTSLEVRRSNETARRLYERFGFSVAGVRRGYYSQPPEDALLLCREGFPDTRS